MKKLTVLFAAIALVMMLGISHRVEAASRVRGYNKRNGSYVAPHYKTSPNNSKWDNWSSRGNYNPYTGKKGYKSLW